MSFYEVSLKGSYAGQDVVNVLWYRNGTVFADGEELFGLLNAMAAQVRDDIWRAPGVGSLRGRGLAENLPTGFTMEKITVNAYNDAFDLLSDTPVTLDVNEPGLRAGESNGPTTCVILKANLEPSFGPGIGLPKRGYIAPGPIVDGDIDSSGHLTDAALGIWNAWGANVATNIATVLPAAIFFPIRVRVTRAIHVVTLITYKDVDNFVCRRLPSYRKSRQLEA